MRVKSSTRPATWILRPRCERSPSCPRRAIAVFDAGRRGAAAVRDRLAPGEQISGPRIAFFNKMDRVGADFDARDRVGCSKKLAQCLGILIPLGKEDYLKGQLDVVNKKAIIYLDNDLIGSTYEVRDLPEGIRRQSTSSYADLVEHISNIDDEIDRCRHSRTAGYAGNVEGGIRRRRSQTNSFPWSAAARSRTSAVSGRCSHRFCRAHSTFPG